jgi:uncharacterized membrane protein (DUF4010 family)
MESNLTVDCDKNVSNKKLLCFNAQKPRAVIAMMAASAWHLGAAAAPLCVFINSKNHAMLTLSDPAALIPLSVALGIGLLVGTERERHKGSGPHRRSAGIRTFTGAAMLGFAAQSLDAQYLVSAALLALGALTMSAYQQSRQDDPGLTSEVAILLTCLLGAMSRASPDLAAIMGIALAAILAAREEMHRFVHQVITEQELKDVIVFLAAAMILLPLSPDLYTGPFQAINPHDLARFVVAVMSISALGYMAKRTLGMQAGMALTGFAGGFVSSTATILAMGQVAQREPQVLHAAAMGAVLSTVSTMVQLGLLMSILLPDLLAHMLLPIGLGCSTAGLYALWLYKAHQAAFMPSSLDLQGHAFEHKTTLILSLAVLSITVMTAALNHWLGEIGVLIASMLAGLVDAHSSVASMSSLVHQGQSSLAQAQLAILLAVSTNTLSKSAVAIGAGGKAFAVLILPGLLLVITAVWLGAWTSQWAFGAIA